MLRKATFRFCSTQEIGIKHGYPRFKASSITENLVKPFQNLIVGALPYTCSEGSKKRPTRCRHVFVFFGYVLLYRKGFWKKIWGHRELFVVWVHLKLKVHLSCMFCVLLMAWRKCAAKEAFRLCKCSLTVSNMILASHAKFL